MTDEQRTSGDLIDRYRRSPKHCLYCTAPAVSVEHIVPEAIGGRLTANILCPQHNSIVNRADEPLSKNFAPLVTMLRVPRHRGGTGAEFRAVGVDGEPVTILAEGFVKLPALEVEVRDENRRILRAKGDLEKLDAIPIEAFSEKGDRNIIAVITNPEAKFAVSSTEVLAGGVLKMALHFFAGFVGDVQLETATDLLRYILGEEVAASKYVRTPFLTDDAFPDLWPPQHDVSIYPDGENVLVTVLLFGAYAYTCRLPFRMPKGAGLRYRQVLSDNFPRFYENDAVPTTLSWNSRPGPDDVAAWGAPVQKRLERIYAAGTEQAVQARCERAYERAQNEAGTFGDSWTRYKAALEIEAFSAVEVTTIIAIGRRLAAEGKIPWKIPVESRFDED